MQENGGKAGVRAGCRVTSKYSHGKRSSSDDDDELMLNVLRCQLTY